MRLIPICLAAIACFPAYAQPKAGEWQPLFDGKSLQGWREAPFTYHGKISVANGTLVLGAGAPMTGATYTGDFPKTDYEVSFEAERLRGGDFFASLTFPVGDSFCTWVAGGWGGDIVGLSSIDNWDASENETRAYFNFERARWYRFRIQVTLKRIQAWIDDQQVINVNIEGRSIALRFGEMKLSAPLGFASYNTEGAVRKIEYRLMK
jgi:hypothetical protein